MDPVRREKLFAYVKGNTEKMFAATLGSAKEPTRQEKAVIAAKRIGGCQTDRLLDLLDIIFDQKLPRDVGTSGDSSDGGNFLLHACVVPVKQTNGHDYKIGKAVVSSLSHSEKKYLKKCAYPDGGVGNWLCSSNVRPATDAEINEWLDDAGDRVAEILDVIVL